MGRICITYTQEPERDRWVPGDRFLRPLVRRIVRGRPRAGGIDKVFINLRLGLDRLGIPYEVNIPFSRLRPDDMLGVLGRGRSCLHGYRSRRQFVAGIGLMTHPSEWPTLFEDYPVACYLQHSEWTAAIYRRYYGDRCQLWPVGIDTEAWKPGPAAAGKPIDLLIYDKIHWDRPKYENELVGPIIGHLGSLGRSHVIVRYGDYEPGEYRSALMRSKAAIFLSAHESQGIACEEALAAGVPVLAWDPGSSQDPDRFRWGDSEIATTSVPYFDERCGLRFQDFPGFTRVIGPFLAGVDSGGFSPRDYILENLTVEKCSQRFVDILKERLR
jgi:glycosyltransferase involved in cell wall biosynthesis